MIETHSCSLDAAIAMITSIAGLAGEGVPVEYKRDDVTVRNPKESVESHTRPSELQSQRGQ